MWKLYSEALIFTGNANYLGQCIFFFFFLIWQLHFKENLPVISFWSSQVMSAVMYLAVEQSSLNTFILLT